MRNGYAVGVGLTVLVPCEVRIASENAQMSLRFIKVGLIPELGSTRRMAQNIVRTARVRRPASGIRPKAVSSPS